MNLPQSIEVRLPWEETSLVVKVTEDLASSFIWYVSESDNVVEILEGVYTTQICQWQDRCTLHKLLKDFIEEYIPRDELIIIDNANI
jgi:hypothetical protein